MIDSTLHKPDTDSYYSPPHESNRTDSWNKATCDLWNEISENTRLMLEHAYRKKRRPYPWNESCEDPQYISCLEYVSPDDFLDVCAAEKKTIPLADWLRIHDLRLAPLVWPRYNRTSIAVIEAASRALLPKTIVALGSIAGIPASCFAASQHTPKRHVLVCDAKPSCSSFSVSLDSYCPSIEQLSTCDAKVEGIGADLVIGSFLSPNLEWSAQPGMSGDLITGGYLATGPDQNPRSLGQEFIQLMSASLRPTRQVGPADALIPEGIDKTCFLICPTDPNLYAFEKTLDNLKQENLAIAAMLTVEDDDSTWIVIQRGARDTIQSILTKSANDPRIEEFLRFVFGTSDTVPMGMMATPSNRFLSPLATLAAEQFRKRAERTKMPLVQPGDPGNVIGADLLYGLWRSICLESGENYRGPQNLSPTLALTARGPGAEELNRYLDGWFRSSLGSAYGRILEMSCLGESEAMWPTDRLPALPLPEVEVRRKILDLHGRILTLEANATILQDEIWTKPLLLKEHEKKLNRINELEGDPTWIDDIPFPIANIVWQIHTAARAKDRLDLLLKLFEGLASFHASILISMAVGHPFFCNELKTILPELRDKGCDIRRATFGTWVQIYERLAKGLRSEDSGKAPTAEWLGSTAEGNSDLLGKLASKEISRILKCTNNLRNRISGHGPVITEEAASKHVDDLQAHLASWRKEVGSVWHELRLLQATDQMSKRSGTYQLQVRILAGARQPFPLETVSLTHALDSDRLHLHLVGSSQALELLPFIRISEPPVGTQAACYFYNRRESDGAHFVSYHYGDTPEKTFPSDPADILFDMLG